VEERGNRSVTWTERRDATRVIRFSNVVFDPSGATDRGCASEKDVKGTDPLTVADTEEAGKIRRGQGRRRRRVDEGKKGGSRIEGDGSDENDHEVEDPVGGRRDSGRGCSNSK